MTPTAELAIRTEHLGKCFRKNWAVRDCTLEVPAGRLCGLVGANGAGKSTLIRMLVGLTRPSLGRAEVAGRAPQDREDFLRSIGYLAQDVPLYGRWTAEDHLRMGKALNPGWEDEAQRERLRALDIPFDRRIEHLSGGMRAQVALAIAMGKQPDVLLLDEPVAALDPLARREVLRSLTLAMTERPMTMLLSSHLLPDLERVCDHLIVMADGRAVLADDVDEIRRTHKLVHLPLVSLPVLARQHEVISEERDGTHASVLARLDGPVLDPAWEIADVSLEEIVLGHLGRPPMPAKPQARPTMGVVR